MTRATLTSAITGTNLETSIRTEVIASVLNAASAQGADWIGTQAQNGSLNAFGHAFAHAVAGCVAGAAGASAPGSGISTGNGCGAGALGAAVGELSAQLYGAADPAKTVAFASMISGIAAALTGQSAQGVAIASGAGANAAQNNYLNHSEILAFGASWKQCATSECKNKLLAQYRALSIQHDKELAACTTFDCVAGHLYAIREADSALATAYQVDPTGQLGMIVNNWQRQAQTVIAPVTVNQKNLIGSRKDSLVLYMNQFCRGMSSSACATQMLQNGKTTKILGELAYMAAMLTPVGTVDDAKSLLTGTDLTGQDSNRLLAVLGVVTAGEGTAIRKVVEEAGGLIKLAKTAVKDSPDAVKLTQELEAANKTGIIALDELSPVSHVPSGGVSATKFKTGSYALIDLTPQEKSLAQQISSGADNAGNLTEQLVGSVAKRQGLKVLDGGKYGSNNGFDHVLQSPDGTVTILLDSKQIANGSAKLSVGAGKQMQLTDKWVQAVLFKLDKNSPAYKAVETARDNGTLVKGIAGVDRNTGQLTMVRVK